MWKKEEEEPRIRDGKGQASLLGKTDLACAELEELRCLGDVLISRRLHEAQQKGTWSSGHGEPTVMGLDEGLRLSMCSEQGAGPRTEPWGTPTSKEQRGQKMGVQQGKASRGTGQVKGGQAEQACQGLLGCPEKQGSRSVCGSWHLEVEWWGGSYSAGGCRGNERGGNAIEFQEALL